MIINIGRNTLMNVGATLKKFGLEKAFDYLYKNPNENLLKILKWAEKYSGKPIQTRLK